MNNLENEVKALIIEALNLEDMTCLLYTSDAATKRIV